MKKVFKIIGITLLILIALLVAIPFAFQGQIKDMVKQFINKNLNAQVEFSDVNLSFIRSFPQAQVNVNDLKITNLEPFKDETFATIKDISFTMSIKELFKTEGEDAIAIDAITINEALLTLKTDAFGNNNYDITKADTTHKPSAENKTNNFAFSIEDYQIKNSALSGDFKVKGLIKGLSSDDTIPNLDISITSNNASFKYPDLPKGVENIVINTEIKNTTGNVNDTYIDIKTLNFKIDNDVFKSSATLKNITKNMLVNANVDGVLNLANITKAYPVELDNALTGILKAKLNTAFDMNAIETNAYERIKNSGTASISDFAKKRYRKVDY